MAKFKLDLKPGWGEDSVKVDSVTVEADSFEDNDHGDFVDFLSRGHEGTGPEKVFRVASQAVKTIRRLPDQAS
jgi:hypothetical protein